MSYKNIMLIAAKCQTLLLRLSDKGEQNRLKLNTQYNDINILYFNESSS